VSAGLDGRKRRKGTANSLKVMTMQVMDVIEKLFMTAGREKIMRKS
jgi:hypothetical protein